MSIVFDDSELQTGIRYSPAGNTEQAQVHVENEDTGILSETEKGLLDLFRKLPEEHRSHVLTQIHKLLKPVGKTRKINVLKAIEDAKQSVAHENLSDIINDIVK